MNDKIKKIRLKKESDDILVDSKDRKWQLRYSPLKGYLANVSYEYDQTFYSDGSGIDAILGSDNLGEIEKKSKSINGIESEGIRIKGDFVHTNAYVCGQELNPHEEDDNQNIRIQENYTNSTKLYIVGQDESDVDTLSSSYGFYEMYDELGMANKLSNNPYATCFIYISKEKVKDIVEQLQKTSNIKINISMEIMTYSENALNEYFGDEKDNLLITDEINSFTYGSHNFPCIINNITTTVIDKLNPKEILSEEDLESDLDLKKYELEEENERIKLEKKEQNNYKVDIVSKIQMIQVLLVLIFLVSLYK